MLQISKAFLAGEEGQDLAEYGLLGALIAVVCVLAVTTFGQELKNLFDKANTDFPK